MTYKLKFLPIAQKEWQKLDANLRSQLKKKIAERLEHPHVQASRLRGFENCYKIKLRARGYRVVYQVNDQEVCILIIAIAKREKGRVYALADRRSRKLN